MNHTILHAANPGAPRALPWPADFTRRKVVLVKAAGLKEAAAYTHAYPYAHPHPQPDLYPHGNPDANRHKNGHGHAHAHPHPCPGSLTFFWRCWLALPTNTSRYNEIVL